MRTPSTSIFPHVWLSKFRKQEKGKTVMPNYLVKVVLVCASFLMVGRISYGASLPREQRNSPNSAAQSVNVIVQWNKVLLMIVRTPGAQPATVHPTRSFAIMHAAIFDAVNAIDSTHEPYLVHLVNVSPYASQDAAAASAAHDVLVALYPKFQAMLDDQLQQSLASLPDNANRSEGISVGKAVANKILVLRNNDGSDATPAVFVFTNPPAPGQYQSTPPNFPKQPQFTHWARVTPFALESASQFRPGPPPALDSDTYSDAFNEVKSLGIASSTAATQDQSLTGRFWNGAIQNYWNEIGQTAAQAHELTTAQSARLFALLNLSFADGVIAFYDAKYTYNFWRPVTAIREAGIAGNPETLPDPNWLPEVGNTTPDPSYPGAHAVISSAAGSILSAFFGKERFDFAVTSEVLPGVERSFKGFSAANKEATLSRIFAGVHFRPDLTAGQKLGRRIADFVFDNFLTPIEKRDDNDR
jgi:PAP2 superfamily